MTNSNDIDESDDANSNTARPSFLSLSLKRNQFYPTLPTTPENGSVDSGSFRGCEPLNWEILTSPSLRRPYYDDVFSIASQSQEKCEVNTVSSHVARNEENKQKATFSNICRPDDTSDDNNCCSPWLRAFLRKLWVKAPQAPPAECNIKPRQLTILEREFSRKPKSPRGLRRVSKKRHNATSHFVYIAYVEDTVRELREERHDDVIYAITVKKDTLTRNVNLPKTLCETDIMREKGTSRHLKGATLDHMVGRLARVFVGDNEDANFLNVFLTTYRTFASPEDLFTKLSDEYMKLKAESSTKNTVILRSIVRVLRAWLERYYQDDFHHEPDHQLLRRLLALARVHDNVASEKNDVDPRNGQKSQSNGTAFSLSPRKNGVVAGSAFAEYVAAKLVVATKLSKKELEEPFSSPLASPTHSQNPSLDVTEENIELNSEPAKQLISLSSRFIAAQLTVIAAKLFHRVQPHHCLAAVVSSKNGRPASVRATIDQFNRVVYCVVGTCLCPNIKISQRTKLLTKWIEVAQECRELKNFSSLRAIVSALHSYALHRLKRAWLGVPHSHINLLKELAEINMKDLIMKVGTAKVNTEDSSIHRVRKDAAMRRNQDIHSGIMHGTVPYLGSFLTDLTYLDTARPDFLEGGLINFEKRRKEFELLAQLQLWQASCRSYQNLEPDSGFMEWFRSTTVLTEEQTFQLSELIEPPTLSIASPAAITSPLKRTISEMFSPGFAQNEPDGVASTHNSNSNKNSHKNENDQSIPNKFSQSFNGRITPTTNSQNRVVKLRLVRNRNVMSADIFTDNQDKSTNNDVMSASCEYKSITISSNERTAAVIRKSLDAYMLDVESNLKRFSLVQIVNDTNKEIQIPDSANVFYAMCSSDHEPTLVLLEEGAEIATKVKRHQSSPNKPKKHRHRKNHSVSHVRHHESSPSRMSPRNLTSAAASPMRSLYRQIALGSVALAGGSYSPSEAARRSSDGEEIPLQGHVPGDRGVVLLNSRTGLDTESDPDDIREPWRRRVRQMRASLSDASLLTREQGNSRRPMRCYSADYVPSVVLPVRVVKPSVAFTTSSNATSKSAPTSPTQLRKEDKGREVTAPTSGRDVLTATGRLIEWPRYTNTNTTRSATWSSRRAMRKTKKHQSMSTFYVRRGAVVSEMTVAPNQKKGERSASSRSKFYVDDTTSEEKKEDELPKQSSSDTKVTGSKTLPPRFIPDFSGHDHEVEEISRSSCSLDTKRTGREVPLKSWSKESTTPRKLDSSNSLSSNLSNPEIMGSDTSSCISFAADNVFDEEMHTLTPEGYASRTSSTTRLSEGASGDTTRTERTILEPPEIKIQCASPENFLDSPFFDQSKVDESSSQLLDADESESSASGTSSQEESDQENNTYL